MSMFFINKFNSLYGLDKKLSYAVMEVFQKYEWPGNIRELENFIERIMLTSESDTVGIECLPANMKGSAGDSVSYTHLDVYKRQ